MAHCGLHPNWKDTGKTTPTLQYDYWQQFWDPANLKKKTLWTSWKKFLNLLSNKYHMVSLLNSLFQTQLPLHPHTPKTLVGIRSNILLRFDVLRCTMSWYVWYPNDPITWLLVMRHKPDICSPRQAPTEEMVVPISFGDLWGFLQDHGWDSLLLGVQMMQREWHQWKVHFHVDSKSWKLHENFMPRAPCTTCWQFQQILFSSSII